MAIVEEPKSLVQLIESSLKTDRILSAKWIVFPIANLAVWTIFGVLTATSILDNSSNPTLWLGLVVMLGFTFSIGTGYVVYRIIDRRNKHFARDNALLSKAIEQLQANLPKENRSSQILANNAERDLFRIMEQEHEQSSILWALLCTIPFVGQLVAIVATQRASSDFKRHRLREAVVYGDIQTLTGHRAPQTLPSSSQNIQDGFFELSIITILLILGGFLSTLALFYFLLLNSVGTIVVLWIGVLSVLSMYIAIISPNEHFSRHRVLDSSLLQERSQVGAF